MLASRGTTVQYKVLVLYNWGRPPGKPELLRCWVWFWTPKHLARTRSPSRCWNYNIFRRSRSRTSKMSRSYTGAMRAPAAGPTTCTAGVRPGSGERPPRTRWYKREDKWTRPSPSQDQRHLSFPCTLSISQSLHAWAPARGGLFRLDLTCHYVKNGKLNYTFLHLGPVTVLQQREASISC
jgi:hypothetical protein